MSAYQEAEILHLEIIATRQIRASVLATHEFPCLSCRRLALLNNQMVVDTANRRSGRHLSFAVSMTIWLYSRAEHVVVKVLTKTKAG